jgi:hypothetical protein
MDRALKIGDKMPDGTIYAGISPDTKEPMYAAPADAPLTMKFNEARRYAAGLDACGHKDWRVPTMAELQVLFNNRAAIKGFKEDHDFLSGENWYWASNSEKTMTTVAWSQFFGEGSQFPNLKDCDLSVRLVRTAAPAPNS